jgi:ankyrin repeat protein
VCLLEHGADLTVMNEKGETVLDLMIQKKWSRSVTELLRFRFRFSEHVKNHPEARRVWFRRKLTTLKCIVKFLSLHQRAVVTANHPLRKLARGEFKDESQ